MRELLVSAPPEKLGRQTAKTEEEAIAKKQPKPRHWRRHGEVEVSLWRASRQLEGAVLRSSGGVW